MTLEEFRRIICTPDSEYVKYFDEHIVLYEILKGRFDDNIKIEMRSNKHGIIYTLILDNPEDINNLLAYLNGTLIFLFGYEFNITANIEQGNLIITLIKKII